MMQPMEATRMLLIRHGETDWNRDRRVQGHLDIGLNATGRAQARRLGAALAERDAIARIYSSDLVRALDTARAMVHFTHAALVPMAALRERHFGTFEGLSFAQASAQFPDQAWHWQHRTPDWSPPGGGESLLVFRQRVLATIRALGAKNIGQHIALVTHGGVLDILYRAATGLGLQDTRTWKIGNATINRVLWTPHGGLRLIGWNDAMHLANGVFDENTA